MKDFIEHVRIETPKLFDPSELNEVIQMTCNIIARAIYELCDTVSFTSERVTWSKDGNIVGHFTIHLQPTMTFSEAFKEIIKRDKTVQQHFHLILDTPQEKTYQIILE